MAKKTNNNLKKNGRFWLYLVLMLSVPLLSCISNFAIRHYAVSYTRWEFISGVLIVVLADIIVYVLYRDRVWVWDKKAKVSVNKIWEILSLSNVVSLLISIGILFPVYFGFFIDEEARAIVTATFSELSFFNGKLIINIVTISQYIPVMNVGLAAIVVLWILSALCVPVLRWFSN